MQETRLLQGHEHHGGEDLAEMELGRCKGSSRRS